MSRRNPWSGLVLSLLLILNACPATQERYSSRNTKPREGDSGASAYIWIAGERISYWNNSKFASIIKIDNAFVPQEYLPVADSAPVFSRLLEIATGRHTVKILYKEDTSTCGYTDCIVVNKTRQTLTLIALAGET